jgi:Ca-activated chloride channel homolog
LRQPVREGFLPITLFLTDGLPTVGRTSEIEIREMVAAANAAGRRIFTFGVGEDVNVPLLDRISDTTRATSTYVLPGEDVELKVAKVYQELYGPVLADLELEVVGEDGELDTRLVRELLPERLPDLFEGDHLVLLGQYREERPLRFRLSGNFLGEQRSFAFEFGLEHASTKNAFVPRLWAARRIAFLADQIRQAGAAITANPQAAGGAGLFQDPRYRELSEEILRLSTRFGILSEYTSFLATEGTDLGSWGGLVAACNVGLNDLAVLNRFGESAVQQGRNFNDRKVQSKVDYGNAFWVGNETKTSFSSVQQICDRAFFKQGERWIDSNLIEAQTALQPTVTYAFGSEEHATLLEQLVREGRQGLLSLDGEILIQVGDQNVLVTNDAN